MARYDLESVEPPALPIAPRQYVQGERDRYSNVLRLYFTRISSFIKNLSGPFGGRFLDFPNGAFSDTQDYALAATSVAAPLRFDTTDYTNGVSILTDNVTFTATVDNGAGGSGNILTVTGLTSEQIYPGMVIAATGLTVGTYVQEVITPLTSYRLSTSANLSSRTMTGTGTSKVQVAYPGRYNFQFSIQFVNSDNAQQDASVWFRKNSTDVVLSNSDFGLPARKSAGVPSRLIGSLNFFIDLEANDYIQIMWRVSDTDLSIEHFDAVVAAAGTPAIPATPSVILTVNFVSRLANT